MSNAANNCVPTEAYEKRQRAGVILYRRGNGFEFLMLKRHRSQCAEEVGANPSSAAATSTLADQWELPKGPLDALNEEVRLVALRNTHQSTGIWPDCFSMHRDFERVSRTVDEEGRPVEETYYLAEIDKTTRSGDAIDSETLPKPATEAYAAFQWMSADLAKLRIRTDAGRLLLGQATEFLESQDQMENVFNVLARIK